MLHGWMGGILPMRLRHVIFWLYLAAGVTAGSVIFVMSVTGVLLTFERQVVAFAERHSRTVQPPPSDAPRLGPDATVSRAREAVPEGQLTHVTLSAHPTAAALIGFGREQVVLVDPYTGSVMEGATTLRGFFHAVTDWHRWLGAQGESREIGRAVTGACNAAFVVLVTSGFYLWWPRRWTRVALRNATLPSLKLRGKARDWSWHNAVGFWSAPVLFCIALTGVVMSYQWANNLLYTLTGNEPPPTPQRSVVSLPREAGARQGGSTSSTPGSTPDGRGERRTRPLRGVTGEGRAPAGASGESDSKPVMASLDAVFAAAVEQAPNWRLMHIRLPQHGAAQMTVMIEEATSLHPYPRSTLSLDVATATVVKWEPFANYNLGRAIRFWVRPVHTGEAAGFIGQFVAALVSAGGAVLVYTGLALACRRLWQFVRRRRQPDGLTRKEGQDILRSRAL
jgi:uncharacterized iron-regulated membrane protein